MTHLPIARAWSLMLAAGASAAFASAQTILIDLGLNTQETTGNWNNASAAVSTLPAAITGLIDSDGNTTSIDLAFAKSFGTASNIAGSAANWDGPYPAELDGLPPSALRDGLFVQQGGTGTLTFSGLDTGSTYSFTLYGARGNNGGGAVYAFAGTNSATSTITNVYQNSTEVATVNGISPSAGGVIALEFTQGTSGLNGSLNFIRIEAFPARNTGFYGVLDAKWEDPRNWAAGSVPGIADEVSLGNTPAALDAGYSIYGTVLQSGEFDAASGNELTDNDADFSSLLATDSHWLEILSGETVAATSRVASGAGTVLTTVDDLSALVSAGTPYRVRRGAWTSGGDIVPASPHLLRVGPGVSATAASLSMGGESDGNLLEVLGGQLELSEGGWIGASSDANEMNLQDGSGGEFADFLTGNDFTVGSVNSTNALLTASGSSFLHIGGTLSVGATGSDNAGMNLGGQSIGTVARELRVGSGNPTNNSSLVISGNADLMVQNTQTAPVALFIGGPGLSQGAQLLMSDHASLQVTGEARFSAWNGSQSSLAMSGQSRLMVTGPFSGQSGETEIDIRGDASLEVGGNFYLARYQNTVNPDSVSSLTMDGGLLKVAGSMITTETGNADLLLTGGAIEVAGDFQLHQQGRLPNVSNFDFVSTARLDGTEMEVAGNFFVTSSGNAEFIMESGSLLVGGDLFASSFQRLWDDDGDPQTPNVPADGTGIGRFIQRGGSLEITGTMAPDRPATEGVDLGDGRVTLEGGTCRAGSIMLNANSLLEMKDGILTLTGDVRAAINVEVATGRLIGLVGAAAKPSLDGTEHQAMGRVRWKYDASSQTTIVWATSADIPHLTLSNARIISNSIDLLIGTLAKPDGSTTPTFILASGPGDDDNDAFFILDDELWLKNPPNFHVKPYYSIRVQGINDAPGIVTVLNIVVIDDGSEPPPPPEEVEIISVSHAGTAFTLAYDAQGAPVDIYRSADLQNWGTPVASGHTGGTYVDNDADPADFPSMFYRVVRSAP
jgi:hypothetical protein